MRTATPFARIGLAVGLASLAACGEVTNFNDAGADDDPMIDGDVEIDAPDIDAPAPMPMTVRVLSLCCTRPQVGVAGAEVYAVGPDGTLRDSGTTDASGEAMLDVLAGDSVTAVYPPVAQGAGRRLRTMVGVQPGETIEFGDFVSEPTTTLGTMNFTWPAQTNMTGFRVYTSCTYTPVSGGTTTQTTVTINSQCPSPFKAIVLALEGNVVSRFAIRTNITFTNGGTVNFGALAPATSFILNANNLPPDLDEISVDVSAIFDFRAPSSVSAYGEDSPTSLTAAAPWTTAPDGLGIFVYMDRYNELGYQYQYGKRPTATSLTLSDIVALPWIGGVLVSPAARFATWIEIGDEPYDIRRLSLYWYPDVPNGGPSGDWAWDIWMPPGGPTMFALPSAGRLADYLPTEADNLQANVGVFDFEELDPDEVRVLSERILQCPTCRPYASPEYPTWYRQSWGNGSGGGNFAVPPQRARLDARPELANEQP